MNTVLLRDALEVSGLNQRELAARCEVHESHMCRILAGKARPSKRLYRDILLRLNEAIEEPPSQPWRMRVKGGLTPPQVKVLVALHHGGCGAYRFPHFITIAKALHRKGLLQTDHYGYGHHFTPAAQVLIQKWMTTGIYDEVLTEL